jgi:branched-chain amino acid transport system permease protein
MNHQRRRITIVEGSPQHIALRLARAAAVIAVACALPYLVEPFRISQITGACTYAIVIVGLNLLSGFGGQISLGHAAFFGLGAYTTGILTTEHGVSPLASFAVDILLAFVVGALVALPALRLKGIYVALVTLAVGLIFPALVSRFASITGGAAGLFGVAYDPPDLAYFSGFNGDTLWHYWLVMIALGVSCLIVRNLVRSRFGRGLVALRDNEAAAIVMGVQRTAVRAVTFGTSAAIASLAGGLFAVTNGILTPDSFSLLLTLYFLAGVIIGGTGSLWGPIFGGFIVYYVPIWAADLSSVNSGSNLGGVFLGAIIILITFALRTGVLGLLRSATGFFFVLQPRTPTRGNPDARSWPPDRSHDDFTPGADSAAPKALREGIERNPDGIARAVQSDASYRI